MNTRLRAIVILAVVALCLAWARPAPARSYIAYISDSTNSSSITWIAKEAGIFKKHGLDLDTIFINGSVRGKLTTTDAVSVGSSGVVEADITGVSLSVAGQVTGDVTASERVDLQSGGRLIGDVKASRLTIADGASFKGNVDMDV